MSSAQDFDTLDANGQDLAIRRRIEAAADRLTSTERRIAAVLLADYPFAGLETIQALCARTGGSQASITRFAQKLGCRGYQDFQQVLIAELKDRSRSPVDLYDPEGTITARTLSDFSHRAARLVGAIERQITEAQFRRVCDLLADSSRSIHVIGGRISDAVALHLSRHLRQVRAKVYHLPGDPEQWPEYLLRMQPRDILVMLDFRRYQANLDHLARAAVRRRKASVVLITDKWLSPIGNNAADVLIVPTEMGTAWDSTIAAMTLIEAIIVDVSARDWAATRKRIKAWDALRLNPPGDP